MKYAVVVYSSFDSDICVYLFHDYNSACEYLAKMWKYCYDLEMDDCPERVDPDGTYCNENYAQIQWDERGDYVKVWQATDISEPMAI